MNSLASIWAVCRRELGSYFTSPVAYVFLIIFLVLVGFCTFMFGGFLGRNQASLLPFFTWHPWLYLFLVPAIGMRLWAEDRRSGAIELLLTLPITPWQAIVGKFLAAWCVLAAGLALTFPMVITVIYLGDPDGGVIVTGYAGSLLVAGAYLALTSMTSAMTRNQVISFILSFVLCLFLLLAGWPPVTELLKGWSFPWRLLAIGSVGAWLGAAACLGCARLLSRVARVHLALLGGLGLLCAVLLLGGGPLGQRGLQALAGDAGWAQLVDGVATLSAIPHFEGLQKGLVSLQDLLYFGSLIVFGLFATGVILRSRRAQ